MSILRALWKLKAHSFLRNKVKEGEWGVGGGVKNQQLPEVKPMALGLSFPLS